MKKTDNLMNESKKRLVVRFIYRNPATPSCDVIELNQEQWNEFMRLQSMTNRIDMILELLGKDYISEMISELAWIPLDDDMELIRRSENSAQ